jgi:hypothetical protein
VFVGRQVLVSSSYEKQVSMETSQLEALSFDGNVVSLKFNCILKANDGAIPYHSERKLGDPF